MSTRPIRFTHIHHGAPSPARLQAAIAAIVRDLPRPARYAKVVTA